MSQLWQSGKQTLPSQGEGGQLSRRRRSGASHPNLLLPTQLCAKRENPAQGRRSRIAASQLSSSHTGFPSRCCSLQDHSCFLSCHILGLPDGQTVLLECRSYFYHSLHNHFWGWRYGLRLSSCYLYREKFRPTICPTASTEDKLSASLDS